MSNRTLSVTDSVYDYLLKVSLREDEVLVALRQETMAMPQSNMQIAPEQGQFMQLLLQLIGARRAIEVGTFTGYSSICIARALGVDGELICCDTSREFTRTAESYWQRAGLADRIELRLGPADRTLQELVDAGESGSFDFVFIDADKKGYPEYYELALQLLRPGGLVAVDNTLWYGRVADPANDESNTEEIRQFNASLADDQRIDLSLVPIGDGLTLARKR
ncbi:MAG: class I SAM-dependent methyltransferase [Gammaproteobacteria bacterium]|nr:class I SAM-dependent methyltransferase [Gammaproteobacteria bacterium]